MKVLGDMIHVVATTIGLDPAFTFEYGAIGGVWDMCRVLALSEKLGDDAADAVLESLAGDLFVGNLSDGHRNDRRECDWIGEGLGCNSRIYRPGEAGNENDWARNGDMIQTWIYPRRALALS